LRHLIGIALLLSLAVASSLGFGRFAYALLLEPMVAGLGLSYAEAGGLHSANSVGYLMGVLIVGAVVARLGAPWTVRVGMLLVGLTLLLTGLCRSYPEFLLARWLNGVSSGLVFLGGAAAMLRLQPQASSATPVGVYYAGSGIGIVLSGLLVPVALAVPWWVGWRAAWVVMGLAALLVLLLIEPPLRQSGRMPRLETGQQQRARLFVGRDYLMLWPMLLSFGLFGFGYIGYMTFIVAFVAASGSAPLLVQSFWLILGLATTASGFAWGPILRRFSPQQGNVLVLLALTVGALLPVLLPHAGSFALSAVLFGGSFMTQITAVTGQIRAAIPAERWTGVMGNATSCFATGQLIGPTLTGLIADLQGGLALGLLGSGAMLGLAMLVMIFGPRPPALATSPARG
jgi:predicted MFS family arabinose efflux permease